MEMKFKISLKNFSAICRICLLPNDLLPITSTDILSVFKEITNIEVKNDDELPKNICKICIELLEKIQHFIKQSKDNYSILLLALNEKKSYDPKNTYSEDDSLMKSEQNLNEDTKDYFSDSEIETTAQIKENENFDCSECSMKFYAKELLIVHVKEEHNTHESAQKIHGNSTNNCDICKNEFDSNCALLKHKKAHNKKKLKKFKYNCTDCDRVLTSQSALDNHMKTHTGDKPYNCVYCDKKFAYSGSLTGHTRIHTGETPYTCTICSKAYHSSSSLKKHKEKQHFDVECSNEKSNKDYTLDDLEKVQCKLCSKMLNKHGYGTHMRIHTNEPKEFICPFCSKHFKKMSHLDRHVRIHTGERPFVCVICKKSFTQESDLKRHWAIHSGHKEFQCQHCGKLYFTKNALDTHITVHTGSKKLIVNSNICKKPHPDQCDKQSHSTLPAEQRSFLCTICGKSFTASNSLKVHIRLHTGDCPFVCSYCGKAYTNTSNLKRHVMRNHTLEKPHVCMICHKGFHDSTNLKRHVNRVHSVLEMRERNEDGANLNEEIIL